MKKINLVRKENLEILIDSFIEEGGRSRAKFAEKISMAPGQLNQIVGKASRNIGNNLARKIEISLGLPDGFLDQNKDNLSSQAILISNATEISCDKMVKIPLLKNQIYKEINMKENCTDESFLNFNIELLKERNINPENTAYAKITGNSMVPVLPDETIIIVNKEKKSIIDGDMYLIKIGDLLRVRLLYLLPNKQLKTRSYNYREYPDEKFEINEVKIIGRVVWYSAFL